MAMSGCQGKDNISITVKACPQCGAEVEIFSVDAEVQCENCGFTIYNDDLSCVQWCQYAEQCVGHDAYVQLMKVAEAQKERKAAELATKAAAAAKG